MLVTLVNPSPLPALECATNQLSMIKNITNISFSSRPLRMKHTSHLICFKITGKQGSSTANILNKTVFIIHPHLQRSAQGTALAVRTACDCGTTLGCGWPNLWTSIEHGRTAVHCTVQQSYCMYIQHVFITHKRNRIMLDHES